VVIVRLVGLRLGLALSLLHPLICMCPHKNDEQLSQTPNSILHVSPIVVGISSTAVHKRLDSRLTQWRIQELVVALVGGMTLSLSSLFCSFPALPSLSLPAAKRSAPPPSNRDRGSGERCKLLLHQMRIKPMHIIFFKSLPVVTICQT